MNRIRKAVGMEVLQITVFATRVDEGNKLDVTLERIEAEDIIGAKETMDFELYKQINKEGVLMPVGEESIIVPDGKSATFTEGDFSFKLHCPKPKFRKEPIVRIVKDEEGNLISGSVIVEVRVKEDGSINRTFNFGTGDERLKQKARTAVEEAEFYPPEMDGIIVPMTYHLILAFDDE